MSVKTGIANSDSERAYLQTRYRHISETMFQHKFDAGEYMLISHDDAPLGWLRWGYFWDSIPFMNMLYIEASQRQKGYGRQLVTAWEDHMRAANYSTIMTSTLANEPTQHFYRKLGYTDRGALLLPAEPLEIIFYKVID